MSAAAITGKLHTGPWQGFCITSTNFMANQLVLAEPLHGLSKRARHETACHDISNAQGVRRRQVSLMLLCCSALEQKPRVT